MTSVSFSRAARSSLRMGKIVAAIVVAGCSSDLTLPGEGEPVHMSIVNGDGQQGEVDKPLADSLVVSVTDADNRPVVERAVSFNITAGSVTPTTVVTDRDGKATFRWVLGTAAGPQSLEVGIGSSTDLSPKVAFAATAMPGPVDAINEISGDDQTAQVSSPLPEALVVSVVDSFDNPISGVNVIWQAQDGNLDQGVTTTGADGKASALWTLGPSVGSQSAIAQFQGGSSSPAIFNAMATRGPPPELSIVTQPSSPVPSGVVFSRQPVVRLEDSHGNPIAQSGVAITGAIATGGGLLGGTTTRTTNQFGVVQFTDLSITGTSGKRTLIFAAIGHTPATSAQIDVTPPAVSPTMSTISASPSTIEAGSGISTITVTARDNVGSPIAGLPVVIAVSGSGNTVTQPSALTNSNGVAIGTVTSTKTGPKSVATQVGNVSVSQTAGIIVVAGPPTASLTTANVPDGVRLQNTTITITTRDAYGNLLQTGGYAGQLRVSITGSNTSNPNVTDNGDGTYTAVYFPIFKGTDVVAITFNNAAIQGSPYQSQVN
jgi:hypothetical protein